MFTDEITRRALLKAAGAAAVGGMSLAQSEARAQASNRRVAPSEKLVIGIIGVAGRGRGYHMRAFSRLPDVEIGAVCDVYDPHLEQAVAATDGKARAYKDFRKLLEQKDIDAVVVSTPPHWHPLVTLHALEAGKDVLCEKPMSRFPMEAKLMADYAQRFKRVTQVGTQIHATENYRKCVDIVRSGKLGKITSVTNFCTMNDDSEGLGYPRDSTAPAGLDWNMWLGPAPEVPFNIGRFRDGMHRYFKDYVDSWLHELGPHIVDLPFWALELGQPSAVTAAGGRFATESLADVPDTLHALWEFPEKELTMTWQMMQHNAFHFGVGQPSPGRHNGIVFHGKDATLAIVNYGKPVVLDRNGQEITDDSYPQAVERSPGHEREWVDAVKTRGEASCSFRKHLAMHTALNLAHSSLRVGRKLRWDAEKWEVIGDREANRDIRPNYRAPWRLPRA